MSLRAADLRFVLPHHIESTTLLLRPDDLRIDQFRLGLEAAGIRVHLGCAHDRTHQVRGLVVAAAHDADRALQVPARAHLLLGRVRSNLLQPSVRVGQPLLIRGAVTRPETVVPISSPEALRYYLTRMSSPPTLTGRLRNRAFVAMSGTPVSPERFVPASALATLVTEPTRPPLVPALVRSAHALGVPPDARWVLAFGRGDDLQRSIFHLLHKGQRRWVLKFARVPGAGSSFARDEEGLALVRVTGGTTAAHAPTHLGRFDVSGHCGSLESAAPGRPLLELLSERPMRLIDRIAGWILQMSTATAAPAAALGPERHRLEAEVLPFWRRFGAPADLVQQLPDVPAVLQHNDLGTWNVLTDGREFMAVDWESARPAGAPLWDLCYFLADALPRLEDPADPDVQLHRALRLFAGRSPYSPLLFRWLRAAVTSLQIPRGAVGPLVTLCWLHHGLSAEARSHQLGTSAAAPLGHLALLGRHWLDDPALGPSWAAWEDA